MLTAVVCLVVFHRIRDLLTHQRDRYLVEGCSVGFNKGNADVVAGCNRKDMCRVATTETVTVGGPRTGHRSRHLVLVDSDLCCVGSGSGVVIDADIESAHGAGHRHGRKVGRGRACYNTV